MSEGMKQSRFDIYLHGRHIETVYYDEDMAAEEVRKSLINHDGFNTNIVIVKRDSGGYSK